MVSRQETAEFRKIMDERGAKWTPEQREKLVRFYDLAIQESETQNLSTMMAPKEFFEGHVLDSAELLEFGDLGAVCMDLGSGMGVPGVVCAVLGSSRWVLVESEKNKADFLSRVCTELGLMGERADVFYGRGEDFLKTKHVDCVVARAVGTVSKIFAWIEKCSTWNKIVLMKGPKWETEWSEFQLSKWKKKLKILSVHSYELGEVKKQFKIVTLIRVPRGTLS